MSILNMNNMCMVYPAGWFWAVDAAGWESKDAAEAALGYFGDDRETVIMAYVREDVFEWYKLWVAKRLFSGVVRKTEEDPREIETSLSNERILWFTPFRHSLSLEH
jgi:hypothetical protein